MAGVQTSSGEVAPREGHEDPVIRSVLVRTSWLLIVMRSSCDSHSPHLLRLPSPRVAVCGAAGPQGTLQGSFQYCIVLSCLGGFDPVTAGAVSRLDHTTSLSSVFHKLEDTSRSRRVRVE